MSSSIDNKLREIEERLSKNCVLYGSIDEFIKKSGFPPGCVFDFEKVFRGTCEFFRNVKQRTESDAAIYTFVAEAMMKVFTKYGHNETLFMNNIRVNLGYNPKNPFRDTHEDFVKKGKLASTIALLNKKQEQKAGTSKLARDKIEKQMASIGAPDEQALNILKRTDQTTKEENCFLEHRRKEYTKDFNLNGSSDKVILDNVLNDELILRRFNIYLEVHSSKFIAEEKTKVLNRLYNAFDNLGISRAKRKDAEDSATDTLADAAETFDILNKKSKGDLGLLLLLEELEMDIDKYEHQVNGEFPEALFIKHHHQEGFFSFKEAKEWFDKHKYLIPILDEKCAALEV